MRKPALLQHLTELGHGDPETAGAAVKIVHVFTGSEMEPEASVEWSDMELSSTQSLPLDFNSSEMIQTLLIPDGRRIEIQVINPDNIDSSTITPDTEAEQVQFKISSESLDVIQAFGGNVDDTLASLI